MNNLPPVCPGTEDHFEKHVFDPEEGPVLIYWPNPRKPRCWSHDSDYPWHHISDMPLWQKQHIARFQAGAWDDLSTENGDQASTNANEWRSWEKNKVV